jgi:hypothetical protein
MAGQRFQLRWNRVGIRVRNIGGVSGLLAAAGAIFASAALLGACSVGAEYPTVLAPPAPRAEEPMSADQVKQATDALISDRTRLSADAQAAQQASAPATTGTTPNAGAATKP